MKHQGLTILALGLLLISFSCNPPERICVDFHDGEFTFSETVDGELHTTTFKRVGDLEISEYRGQIDSASVRWVNDCEYVLKNLNPKNKQEEKPLHMKILKTDQNGYTFEYSVMGSSDKRRGTVLKTKK